MLTMFRHLHSSRTQAVNDIQSTTTPVVEFGAVAAVADHDTGMYFHLLTLTTYYNMNCDSMDFIHLYNQ